MADTRVRDRMKNLRAQLRVALSEVVDVAMGFHHAGGPSEVKRVPTRR